MKKKLNKINWDIIKNEEKKFTCLFNYEEKENEVISKKLL